MTSTTLHNAILVSEEVREDARDHDDRDEHDAQVDIVL